MGTGHSIKYCNKNSDRAWLRRRDTMGGKLVSREGPEDQRCDDRGSYDVAGQQEAVAQGERGLKAVPGPSIELIPSTSESQGAVSETYDTKEERVNGRPTIGRRDPTSHDRQRRGGLANTGPMWPEDRPFWAAERET
ncbi:hypothetical protein HETIRDRAFT_431169 [Heterobasidion irregulare TC 32-1]|uniref:Uncharacterized protein n=1 Tax=Heterobasidion irregulare (strain TC 32-1) TaxID=747525 RepID=W4JPI7_HETIT|nr:uncharacterized protein HETIRDRAFT_431169 [Heterobasidion irregulare TC 32-1]ETW75005.1 hypothetical protein HETIRDRAFT_431169 [Heterobasidion irregulare TC 32-1]